MPRLDRDERGRFASTRTALERFVSFCRFQPETGCVLWTGGTTAGRGHHALYGSFWDEGRRHFAHRWSAKNIHGLDIAGHDVDHCCPNIPKPNTLCVEHVQSLIPAIHHTLTIRRAMIHLQVGLISYEEVYGDEVTTPDDLVPFYNPPAWLGVSEPPHDDCPF